MKYCNFFLYCEYMIIEGSNRVPGYYSKTFSISESEYTIGCENINFHEEFLSYLSNHVEQQLVQSGIKYTNFRVVNISKY